MCNLFLFNCITPVLIQRAKPFSLHSFLIILILLYAFFGGIIFNYLEGEVYRKQKEKDWNGKVLTTLNSWSLYEPWRNHTANLLSTCVKEVKDERDEWSLVTATLYGFGYNRIAPSTYAGRIFCIVYGICGIPVTMIIIANIGRYMHNFSGTARRKIEEYRDRKLQNKMVEEASTEVTSLFLLFVFLVYVTIGAILLPALNGQLDFINGLYYNFICLTALDFGQLVPTRMSLLPITFLYVCFGLAITTIAIEYMKKLHYLGAKIKSAASTKIWFGGKSLAVKDLLHSVGKKCGIEAKVIDSLDLDLIVEKSIAANEGREVEEDFSPPQEPWPFPIFEDICKQQYYELLHAMLQSPMKSRKVNLPSHSFCEIVYPSSIKSAELYHNVNIFAPANQEFVVVRQKVSEGDKFFEIRRPVEAINLPPKPPPQKIPKNFKERKGLTQRDPKKLYETYQAEWNRKKNSKKPLSGWKN